MTETTDKELLDQLGVEVEKKQQATLSPIEERVLSGFEDIQRFCEEHGRAPQHGAERDIFERLYAVRLDRIIADEKWSALVGPGDTQGLLQSREGQVDVDSLADDELLSELGVEPSGSDLTDLRNVRTAAERKAAEVIAHRKKCDDFEEFKPLFQRVQRELDSAVRTTIRFKDNAAIEPGHWFIVDGLKAFVVRRAEEDLRYETRIRDYRIHVIFENGTESFMLKRSLEKALQKDPRGRRITDPSQAPLFGSEVSEGDVMSGTVYVLRSQSDLPFIKENRSVIHKIGVTTQSVDKRIAKASESSTFLYADVEVVATFALYNVSAPAKFEQLLHKVFDVARLDVVASDKLGDQVSPREWFLLPLEAIEDAVQKLIVGELVGHQYDPSEGRLVKAKS